MVTFDAALPGTDAAAWDGVLAAAPSLDIPRTIRRALIVAAHPDDETLGAGGLIARLGEDGVDVVIACVTDGAAGGRDASGDLPSLRSAELVAARDALAPRAHIVELRFPDGRVREHRSLVREALAALIDRVAPDLVVAPWCGDGHRDHRVVGEISDDLAAERDIRLIGYPVWYWHWGDPRVELGGMERFETIRLTPSERERKALAISGYASQTGPTEDLAVLRPGVLRHFARDIEPYIAATAGDRMARHFERLHRLADDPWNVESSWYERRKASLLMSTIPDERIGRVLEIGASTGSITTRLAGVADSLVAVDLSAAAVDATRRRTAGMPQVEVLRADVRQGLPAGRFDLIVLGEVGYYLAPEELQAVSIRMEAALTPGGAILACHARGRADDMAQSGDEVHHRLAVDFVQTVRHEETEFAIGLFRSRR